MILCTYNFGLLYKILVHKTNSILEYMKFGRKESILRHIYDPRKQRKFFRLQNKDRQQSMEGVLWKLFDELREQIGRELLQSKASISNRKEVWFEDIVPSSRRKAENASVTGWGFWWLEVSLLIDTIFQRWNEWTFCSCIFNGQGWKWPLERSWRRNYQDKVYVIKTGQQGQCRTTWGWSIGPREHLACPLGKRKTENWEMTIQVSKNRMEKCFLAEVKTYLIVYATRVPVFSHFRMYPYLGGLETALLLRLEQGAGSMSLDSESCLKCSLHHSLPSSSCFIFLHSMYHHVMYCVYFIYPLTRISSMRAGYFLI